MSAIPTGGRQTSSATDHEGGPARGDLPPTYACPVRSCNRTWQQQRERDEHVARVHPKTEEAKMARRRNEDRMRTALQHGSRPMRPQPNMGGRVEGIVTEEEIQSADVAQGTVEFAATMTEAQTDTTASWSPLGLETTAAALVTKRRAQTADDTAADVAQGAVVFAANATEDNTDTTETWNPLSLQTAAEALAMERRAPTDDCTAATPITGQGDTRPVVAVAMRLQPWVFKAAGHFDHRRIWPRFRKKYAGRALGLSVGVQKKSKRSSTR